MKRAHGQFSFRLASASMASRNVFSGSTAGHIVPAVFASVSSFGKTPGKSQGLVLITACFEARHVLSFKESLLQSCGLAGADSAEGERFVTAI